MPLAVAFLHAFAGFDYTCVSQRCKVGACKASKRIAGKWRQAYESKPLLLHNFFYYFSKGLALLLACLLLGVVVLLLTRARVSACARVCAVALAQQQKDQAHA